MWHIIEVTQDINFRPHLVREPESVGFLSAKSELSIISQTHQCGDLWNFNANQRFAGIGASIRIRWPPAPARDIVERRDLLS